MYRDKGYCMYYDNNAPACYFELPINMRDIFNTKQLTKESFSSNLLYLWIYLLYLWTEFMMKNLLVIMGVLAITVTNE